MIYLDYASTTPMSPAALKAYSDIAGSFYGNPNSLHDIGFAAKNIIDASAGVLSGIISGNNGNIIFTGSGSEANELALASLAFGNKNKGNHIVYSAMEHASVNAVCRYLAENGFEISPVYPGPDGYISPDAVADAIRPDTILATIQHANSEIGTIQPLEEIGSELRKKNILFHADCVQTLGKIPVDVEELHVDAISVSAHKVYGPKGVGAVWLRNGISRKGRLPGVHQDKGLRQGTPNVPGIAAFASAANECAGLMQAERRAFAELRAGFISALQKRPVPHEIIEGGGNKLEHIVGIRFPGIEGQFMMLECSQHGFAIATGSACQTGMLQPAASMLALGKSEQEAREFVRLSFGRNTTSEELSLFIDKIDGILSKHYTKIKHPNQAEVL